MFRLKDRTPMETGRFDAAVHSEGLTLGSCGPVRPAFVDSVPAHTYMFSGQSPNQDAKAEGLRNRDTSVPIC